jgi:hypothetical protein
MKMILHSICILSLLTPLNGAGFSGCFKNDSITSACKDCKCGDACKDSKCDGCGKKK